MSEKQQQYFFGSNNSGSNRNENSSVISQPVRHHLLHVYLTLAAMCSIATISSQTSDYFGVAGSSIGPLGVLASMYMFRFTSVGSRRRWGLLGAYSLFSGIAISAFISYIMDWDPTGNLIFLSLSSSVLVFLGFSLSALVADRRSMLYIGGIASSVLSILLWTSLANLFFLRSSSIISLELYAGLFAFAGFVMYDTQMIVERASAGLMDVPGHSMELFMDLYSLFIRIANILIKKEAKRDDERRRRRRNNRLERDW